MLRNCRVVMMVAKMSDPKVLIVYDMNSAPNEEMSGTAGFQPNSKLLRE